MNNVKTLVLITAFIMFTAFFSLFSNLSYANEYSELQFILPRPSLNLNSEDDGLFYYNISGAIISVREHPLWITRREVDCKRSADFDSETLKTLIKGKELKLSYEVGGF